MRNSDVIARHVITQLEIGRKFLSSESNWCQGSYVRAGKICISAACSSSFDRMGIDIDVRAALKASIVKMFPAESECSITGFNDKRGRKHADILAVLDDAIVAERAKQACQ